MRLFSHNAWYAFVCEFVQLVDLIDLHSWGLVCWPMLALLVFRFCFEDMVGNCKGGSSISMSTMRDEGGAKRSQVQDIGDSLKYIDMNMYGSKIGEDSRGVIPLLYDRASRLPTYVKDAYIYVHIYIYTYLHTHIYMRVNVTITCSQYEYRINKNNQRNRLNNQHIHTIPQIDTNK